MCWKKKRLIKIEHWELNNLCLIITHVLIHSYMYTKIKLQYSRHMIKRNSKMKNMNFKYCKLIQSFMICMCYDTYLYTMIFTWVNVIFTWVMVKFTSVVTYTPIVVVSVGLTVKQVQTTNTYRQLNENWLLYTMI